MLGVKRIEKSLAMYATQNHDKSNPFVITAELCKLNDRRVWGGLTDLTSEQIIETLMKTFLEAKCDDKELEKTLSMPLLKAVTGIVNIAVDPKPIRHLNESLNTNATFEFSTKGKDKDEKLMMELKQLLSRLNSITYRCVGARPYAAFILAYGQNLLSEMRDFSRELGIELSTEAEVRCLYNYLTLSFHNLILTGNLRMHDGLKRAIYAASAIHPVVDDMMDDRALTELDIEFIRALLLADGPQPGKASNVKMAKVQCLIEWIYLYRSPREHRQIQTVFLNLLDAQIASVQIQSSPDSTIEAILRVSFEKGGFAFALYGCVLLGELSPAYLAHFFTVGAIFQLNDDFHDVSDDLLSGCNTYFTRDYTSNGNIASSVHKLTALQNWFESNTNMLTTCSNPSILRVVTSFGMRYDVFRFCCTNWSIIGTDIQNLLRRGFGKDLEQSVTLFRNYTKIETLDFYLNYLSEMKQRCMA